MRRVEEDFILHGFRGLTCAPRVRVSGAVATANCVESDSAATTALNVIAVTRHANRLTIATRLFSGKGRVYPVRWQLTAIWTAGLASGSDASDEAKSMLERTILNC